MTWLGIIAALLTLAKGALDWAQSRKQIDADKAASLAIKLQAVLDELKLASQVRHDVDARVSGGDEPSKLRDDGAGFFRD